MYLHLGGDRLIKTKDIIGIFDMDTSTVQKNTRNYLKKAEKAGEVITVSYDLPKSFVVVNKKKSKEKTIYITQISSTTLNKRNISKKYIYNLKNGENL